MKKNIYNFTLGDLSTELAGIIDSKYRSLQVFSAIHKFLKDNFDQIPGIPKIIKEELHNKYFLPTLKLISVSKSIDKTQKFLFDIPEYDNSGVNHKIETVLISEDNRNTICVSTQVGCNVGCEFCATGKMGFQRNLDLSQIILQVYMVKKITKLEPSNIVFMGMGEPFLNFDNLIKALKVLTDNNGLGLSSKKITVSTVGFKTKIKKFADTLIRDENKKIKNTKLALSLHTTDQGLREKIIPVAKVNRLPDIYEELIYFYRKTKNKITYEYIFFHKLNDNVNDINRLSRLSGMIPCNFNLIPYHPINSSLKPPLDIYQKEELFKNGKYNSLLIIGLNSFIEKLKKKKVVVNLRSSSGVDINAACGQLATLYQNNIESMHQLLIFGPPGVGKGTQAQLISDKLNLFHLSTGEVLRASAEKGTELGLIAKELMDKGELVPDNIMIGIVRETLLNGPKTGSNGFILDGFPRTVDQAKALNDIFKELKYSNIKVIYLDATEEELLRRLLKRGRSDDNEQSILKRFKLYKNLTSPVLEFYNKNSDIIKINGLGEIDDINKNILSKLGF